MNWRRIVWLLALVTLPTLAEETPLQLVLRGAQHDQLYQLSSSGVTKVSALPDSLTTPLGSLWKLYVYAWLEDTHQPEGNDSNLLIVFYVQIMPDDLVMQLHRF